MTRAKYKAIFLVCFLAVYFSIELNIIYHIVGANCVRPLLISAEFDGRPQVAPTGRALILISY